VVRRYRIYISNSTNTPPGSPARKKEKEKEKKKLIDIFPNRSLNIMSDVEKQYDRGAPGNHAPKESDEIIGRQVDGVDPLFEAKIVRKLDLCIIPIVMMLYLFSFLDR
jgi:hypothetical protein